MLQQSNHLELPLLEIHYPTLECTVSGNGEHSSSIMITALIDTGFDGFLSMPKRLAQELNINNNLKQTEVQLGNGDQVTVDVGQCNLQFAFAKQVFVVDVIIDEDDECLIGMGMIVEIANRFELDFEKEIIRFSSLKV